MPTVVSTPISRQRRPSAIESLTEPPLESNTMVAPPSCQPLANLSKSLGLWAVTTPTALTQPPQFGRQATQLNFIGIFCSSSVAPACAEPPTIETNPSNAMQWGAALRRMQSSVAVRRMQAEAGLAIRAMSETADISARIMSMFPKRWAAIGPGRPVLAKKNRVDLSDP